MSYIGYDDKRCINALQIRNSTTNNVVFEHGSIVELPERASSAQIITIEDICKRHRISPTQLYESNNLSRETLTPEQAGQLLNSLKMKFGDE